MEKKEGETILWQQRLWNVYDSLQWLVESINFSNGIYFVFYFSIFFEPEVFFSKPGELPTKENGGVALLKGKKVQWRYYVQEVT